MSSTLPPFPGGKWRCRAAWKERHDRVHMQRKERANNAKRVLAFVILRGCKASTMRQKQRKYERCDLSYSQNARKEPYTFCPTPSTHGKCDVWYCKMSGCRTMVQKKKGGKRRPSNGCKRRDTINNKQHTHEQKTKLHFSPSTSIVSPLRPRFSILYPLRNFFLVDETFS